MTRIYKTLFILTATIVAGIVFSADAWAGGWTTSVYITGKTPLCNTYHKTLRGNWACIRKIDDQSCIDTAPVDSTQKGGVVSPMCRRGEFWCHDNWVSAHKCYTHRCKRQGNDCVAKNGDGGATGHQGYDYSAAAGDKYYAPCDGELKLGGVCNAPMIFKCEICGKKYEYTFLHCSYRMKPGFYKKGEMIGKVGGVGPSQKGGGCGSFSPHAHIELRGTAPNGEMTLMDPFAPGFNKEVCSCNAEQQNQQDRSDCFDGGDSGSTYNVTHTTGGDQGGVGSGSGEGSNPLENNQGYNDGSGDPDCNYSSVIVRYTDLNCMFCAPFKIIFNTASTMAQKAYDIFAQALIPLIAVGFAIWLALTVMKTVSTFNKVEPRIFIKTMLGQSFKVLVIVFLLMGPLKQIMDLTIEPVFSTGLKIAQLSAPYALKEPTVCGLTETVLEDGGLSATLGNGILCTIKSVQDQIMSIIALGRVCHCLAWTDTTWIIIPNFAYLVSAIVLMLAGFILILIYPFLMLDCILRLAVVVALLPLALAAFAFNMDYLKKIWETFLNAVFTFIFMSLVISIIATIAQSFTQELLTDDVFDSKMGEVLWFTTGGMKLAFICFLGWAVLNEIKPFSSKFGGGIKMDIAPKVGGDAAQLGNKFIVKPTTKAAGKVIGGTASLAHKNISNLHRQVNAARIPALGIKAVDDQGNLMLDDDGNQMYVDNSIRPRNVWNRVTGKKTFRSYSTDANGNVLETKTTLKGDYVVGADGKVKSVNGGSKKTVQTDSFGVLEKAQSGNSSSTYAKLNMGGRKLLEKDGSINQKTWDMFMQNSTFSDDEKQVALVSQLVKERMGDYTGGKLDGVYKKRKVRTVKNAYGTNDIIIDQINSDGTMSTFEAKFAKNGRIMTKVTTTDGSSNTIEYATDGIIQRKAVTSNGETDYEYAISHRYDNIGRPVYTDGNLDRHIDPDNVLFGQDDLDRFGEQVLYHGNRAYDLDEFIE